MYVVCLDLGAPLAGCRPLRFQSRRRRGTDGRATPSATPRRTTSCAGILCRGLMGAIGTDDFIESRGGVGCGGLGKLQLSEWVREMFVGRIVRWAGEALRFFLGKLVGLVSLIGERWIVYFDGMLWVS